MIRKNILSKLLPGSFMLASLLCSPGLQAHTPGNTVEMKQPGIPQERTISGTVTEKGDPLIGATVRVKATDEGTITDLDGKFTIKAAPGAILIVSYIGYVTQEINIGQQSVLHIELLPATQDIDEVVVIGYGTMKKSDITGSLINVSEKVIKQAPVSNVATALQGLAAGVDVQMEGGSTHPGAVATIRVRGERSLNAEKDVLIIVDGIPFSGTLNELSTDDIASVSILKDASATAIYGSRGASGVILITTKRGHAGKTTVNYSGYYGITTPIKQYNLMNSEQFMRMKQWANYNANPDLYSGPDDPSMMVLGALFRDQAEINGYNNGTDTNWQDLVFGNGMTTNHQVSVNGGNEKSTYNSSVGYFRSENSYPGQVFERMTAKLSTDSQITSFLKVGLSSLNTYSNNYGEGDNPTEHALRASPFVTPYDEDGNLVLDIPGSGGQVWNPLLDKVDGAFVDKRRSMSTFTTGYLDVTLPYGFNYRFNGGFALKYETRGQFEDSNTTTRKGGLNRAFADHYLKYEYTLENILTWNKTLWNDHHFNFTGLFSYQNYQRDGNSITSYEYFDTSIQFYNPSKAMGNIEGSGGFQKWQLLSYMARLNYSYKNKYLLTATIRHDGSSRLAAGNKWHSFPSLALGWNILEEEFMPAQDILSSLKLRLSWGNVGSTAIDPYQTMAKLSTNRYMLGNEGVMGVFPNSVPDYSLGWENTETYNIGIDFGFLSNRITGTLELHQQNSKDLLLKVDLPPTTGYTTSYLTNLGKTRNRGVEFNITTVNFDSREFSWITDFNIFANRNKVTYLGEGIEKTSDFFLGQSVGVIWDYDMDGLWQDTPEDRALTETFGYATSGANSVIGTVKIKNHSIDYEEDGVTPKSQQVINEDDKVFLGKRAPNFEGGLNNRFTYKDFDLSFLFSFRYGGTLTSNMHSGWMNTLAGAYNNLNVDYWTPENTDARWPKPSTGTVTRLGLLARYNASYLKLRNITIGYTLPGNIVSKLGAQNVRVYTTGSNLFTWSDKQFRKDGGIDPETTSTINIVTPPVRSFIFGLNVTF